MLTEQGHVELRGLEMGPGTPFTVMGLGPFDREVRSPGEAELSAAHGSYAGREYRTAIRVPLRIFVRASTDEERFTRHQQVLAAFAPSHTNIPLRFWYGGRILRMNGRPRMVEPDAELFDQGKIKLSAGFLALDSFVYSDDEITVSMGLPTDSGGRTYPYTYDYTIDATLASGRQTITNDGNADAPWSARLDGPATNPRIGNLTTGQELRLGITVPAGRFLDLESFTRRVLLDGTASRRGVVSGDWWQLAPGPNEVVFNADTFDPDASLDIAYRHTWS